MKFNLESPQKNIVLRQGYCNDHFKLAKMAVGSMLSGAELFKTGAAITNQNNHDTSLRNNEYFLFCSSY